MIMCSEAIRGAEAISRGKQGSSLCRRVSITTGAFVDGCGRSEWASVCVYGTLLAYARGD